MAKNSGSQKSKKLGKRPANMPRSGVFSGIRDELKQVSWPTREDATQQTIVVIIISLIVALFVGIIDISLTKVLEILTQVNF